MATYLILVGLLAICSLSFGEGNTYTLYCISRIYCVAMCDHMSECLFHHLCDRMYLMCVFVSSLHVNASVSFCISSECNRALLENVDFPGTDITFLFAPDAGHCQQLCTQHASCKFFTFVRADWTRDAT